LATARNCTTLPAGRGVTRTSSTPHALITRRHCCPTARCWWQEDLITAPILPARNCSTRPSGCTGGDGLPRTASTPHVLITRRRCCPTARCWWQAEMLLATARNCTTQAGSAGRGLPRSASTPHVTFTRRRCCPTATCWWQGDQVPSATARNCTTSGLDLCGLIGSPKSIPRLHRWCWAAASF
jgi:hypothetical protein